MLTRVFSPVARRFGTAAAQHATPKKSSEVTLLPEIGMGLALGACLGAVWLWGYAFPIYGKLDAFNSKLRESKHGMSYSPWKGERKDHE